MTKNIFVAEVTFNVTYTERVKKNALPLPKFSIEYLKTKSIFSSFQ